MVEASTTPTENTTGPRSRAGSRGKSSESQDKPTTSKSERPLTDRQTLKSRKSVSNLQPRVKFKLKRALKRNPFFREVADSDLKWFWAAYRKQDFPSLDDGIDQPEFMQRLERYFQGFNVVYTLLTHSEGEMKPVGVVACNDGGYRIEPLFLWFSWATPRNKVESALNFFNKIRVTRLAFGVVPESESRLYMHLKNYGVIQARGKIERFYEDGQFAGIFQTRD